MLLCTTDVTAPGIARRLAQVIVDLLHVGEGRVAGEGRGVDDENCVWTPGRDRAELYAGIFFPFVKEFFDPGPDDGRGGLNPDFVFAKIERDHLVIHGFVTKYVSEIEFRSQSEVWAVGVSEAIEDNVFAIVNVDGADFVTSENEWNYGSGFAYARVAGKTELYR